MTRALVASAPRRRIWRRPGAHVAMVPCAAQAAPRPEPEDYPMTALSVPIIDISGFHEHEQRRRLIAQGVADACTDIGFLVISGHGVRADLIRRMHATNRAFFEMPLDHKMTVARPRADQIRGYSGVESEGLGLLEGTPVPPDLKELFDIGPLDVPVDDPYYTAEAAGQHFARNCFPSQPAGFEATYREYYAAMETLTLELFRIFATALKLPPDHFVSKVDRHISILRTNYYPRQEIEPRPNQIRGGAHRDYTAFTIVWQEDVPEGGLEIQTRGGQWIAVPPVPGTFVVNLGDSMMRWTNDTWVSTMHRVVNPSRAVAREHARMSIAYFVQPNYDAVIECIESCQGPDRPAKYGPIRNGEYLLMKFTQQNTLADAS
jgi:isopenicillin N synthase-like dioxygenase